MQWNLSHLRLRVAFAVGALIPTAICISPPAIVLAEVPPAAQSPPSESPAPAAELTPDELVGDPYAEPAPAEMPADITPSETPSPADEEPIPLESMFEPAPLPTATPLSESEQESPAAPLEGEEPKPALDPASLDGVRPGTTTRVELHKQWGAPAQSQRVAGGTPRTV